jgi:hypothetical protein
LYNEGSAGIVVFRRGWGQRYDDAGRLFVWEERRIRENVASAVDNGGRELLVGEILKVI